MADIARDLGARRDGSDSDYATFLTLTTMKEYVQEDTLPREYAYDVVKIVVLDETPNTTVGADKATKGLYPLTKLVENIQKFYDP